MDGNLVATLQDFYAFAQRKNRSLMYLFAGRVLMVPNSDGEHKAIFNKPSELIVSRQIGDELEQIFNEYRTNKS